MFTYSPTIVGKALRLSHINPLCRILQGEGGGDLAQSLPGCVVTKWRDMGSFGALGSGTVYTFMGMFLQG